MGRIHSGASFFRTNFTVLEGKSIPSGERLGGGIGVRRLNPWRLAFTAAVITLLTGTVAFLWKPWQVSEVASVRRAESGRLERVLEAQAIAVRREEVVVAPYAGRAEVLAAEGSVVPAGAPVIRLVHPAPAAVLQAEWQIAQGQLQAFDAARGAQLAAAERVWRTQARELDQQLDALQEAAHRADAGGVEQVWRRLQQQGPAAAQAKEAWEQLRAERDRLEHEAQRTQQLASQAAQDLAAPMPGAVSYRIDGLENILSPDQVTGLRTLTLSTLPSAASSRNPSGLAPGATAGGQPLFKLVDMQNLFLAVAVRTADWPELQVGDAVQVRLAGRGGNGSPGTVEWIGEREVGGRALILIAVPGLAPQLALDRFVSVQLVLQAADGVVVPEAALQTRGGQDGVFVVRNGAAHWTTVEVAMRHARQAVVRGITPGTEIILARIGMWEGKKIR